MDILLEDPAQADVTILLQHGEIESASMYPAESNHHLSLDGLRAPTVRFFVARDAQRTPIGTGAIVLHGDWAEVKRIWVEPIARGQRLSSAILSTLEVTARGEGIRWLRLETGVHSAAALHLYRRSGYRDRAPFADYVADPLSVFMEKDLVDLNDDQRDLS